MANKIFRKVGSVIGVIIFLAIGLAQCGFEAGAFSSVSIEIPDDLALSSLVYTNEDNPYIDEPMKEYFRKVQMACWKSGWRGLMRSLLSTGPDTIQLQVTDFLNGTRTTTFDCRDL